MQKLITAIRQMKHSLIVGFSFGATSDVITTLGLLIGLHSSTGSKPVIIGGIITIAIADAFSDALGIHISEETEEHHSVKEVWLATISTFLCKFIFSITFLIPVFLFELTAAILASAAWGLLVLSFISYRIAKAKKISPGKIISEHLLVTLVVIASTHYLGRCIGRYFG